MAPLDFSTLLQSVTVDSKDDGTHFYVFDRLIAIETLLSSTAYRCLAEGPLFRLYGKHPVAGQRIVVLSSHIDTVYDKCYCTEDDHHYHGTFDNSLTNAAVLFLMLNDCLPDNVVVAFTGDEEKDSTGCHQLIDYLFSQPGCDVAFALVTDVTNEGWETEAPFTVENDLGIDLFTAHAIVENLNPYLYQYIHHAEPDESWDYHCANIPSLTLCIPVLGNMHSDEGVLARKSSLPVYCEVLNLLAELLSE